MPIKDLVLRRMKKKILDYLSDQEMQHKDLSEIYYNKYKKAQNVGSKNSHYVDYKKHNEAARVLDKAAVVVATIEQLNQERRKK